ncbi:hypothetical protein MMC31_003141 [Peltigera leucophlebia]|nr:hypothetical protein [Peltigera leucophlebia]
MVPWLDQFSKEAGQSAILKFFTEVEIGDYQKFHQCTQDNMLWPLQNLDLTVLKKLTFSSKTVDSSIFFTLNDLFAAGSFVNLTDLHFRFCNLSQTLILTRMPSLQVLEVTVCDFQGPNLPLVLAKDIRLEQLWCTTCSKVDTYISLLTQAKGLKFLFWRCGPDSLAPDVIDEDLIRAVMVHKDTLRKLWFFDYNSVPIDSNLEARLWDSVRLVKSRLNG